MPVADNGTLLILGGAGMVGLQVAREAVRELHPARIVISALTGREVDEAITTLRAETPDGRSLGTVSEMIRAGETDVLVVRPEGSREELLFPAIASVVREVDVAGGRIVVVPQEILG